MIDAVPLTLLRIPPEQCAGLPPVRRRRLLGATCIGDALAGPGPDGLPVQNVAAPLLGSADARAAEAWCSAGACRDGERDGIRYRADGRLLYGVIEIDEAAFVPPAGQTPLQGASEAAYRRIFRLLDAEGYAQLWRVWNYLADINAETDGLERYRQFNVGRHDAFVASGRLAGGKVPAACALGVRGGPLSIAFLAARAAARPLENPRQVSAWNYPPDYGPRSPTFARAALARLPGQEWLFVSGTASITGHRTQHAGDVAAQTRETLANLAAVVGAANRASGVAALPPYPRYPLSGLDYRIYIRHAGDLAAVRAALLPLIGDAAAVYVQADICRADLLVEIEASASRRLGPAE